MKKIKLTNKRTKTNNIKNKRTKRKKIKNRAKMNKNKKKLNIKVKFLIAKKIKEINRNQILKELTKKNSFQKISKTKSEKEFKNKENDIYKSKVIQTKINKKKFDDTYLNFV